jgi:hypothetical protein
MTDAVNYSTRSGSFLTGAPRWFSIATLVTVAETGVKTPVIDLPGYQKWATLGIWTPVTVIDPYGASYTYTNIDDYEYDFYAQRNLDLIVRAVSARANPTQISVKVLPDSINGNRINPNSSAYFGEAGYWNTHSSTVMGTAYDDTGYTISIIDFAFEKVIAWGAEGYSNYLTTNLSDSTGRPQENNDTGYALDVALNGTKIYDWDEILNDSSYTANDELYLPMGGAQYGTINVGHINTSSSTNCNTLVASSPRLAGTLLV